MFKIRRKEKETVRKEEADMKCCLILFCLFVLQACSHSTHLVHVSDYELEKNLSDARRIEALGEQKVVMWFVFDTNYVEEARSKLIAKCPNGKISNISTRYSTSHGFFHWKNKIYMQAMCFE